MCLHPSTIASMTQLSMSDMEIGSATSDEEMLVAGARYTVTIRTPDAAASFEGCFERLGVNAPGQHPSAIFDSGAVSGKWTATLVAKPGAEPTPG